MVKAKIVKITVLNKQPQALLQFSVYRSQSQSPQDIVFSYLQVLFPNAAWKYNSYFSVLLAPRQLGEIHLLEEEQFWSPNSADAIH
jgi:hypothetical protein